MLQAINSFLQLASSVVTFFVQSITGLVNFLLKLPTFISMLSSSVLLMPSILIPFAMLCISAYVVLFSIGRQ